jgi:DNA polymerase III alpha subunit (gram-positive type)
MKKKQLYLGLDTETGGLWVNKNPLLQVGLVVTNDAFRVLHKYEINIKGDKKYCEPSAMKINGIDLVEHNKTALTPRLACKEIQRIITKHFGVIDPVLIGHNLPFDIRFMSLFYEKFGTKGNKEFKYHYHLLDTMGIAGLLKAIGLVRYAGLNKLLAQFGIKSVGRAHTALVDAHNTVKLLKYFSEHVTLKQIKGEC